MAVAVAGVLAAPAAFAQTSNVQLYGRAVLGIDSYSADGARDQANQGQVFTATTNAAGSAPTPAQVAAGTSTSGSSVDRKSRIRIFDSSSRVGLRGTEDLGNGLKAIFQIETGVNIDNGSNTGQGGQVNASSGFWASRDSFVGIDSNFGRVTFGRQSVYWANGVNAQFGANYINTEIPWTNGTQLGRISAQGSVPARVSNMLQYTTPTFAGINGTLSYSPNAQEAVQGEATPAIVAGASTANQKSDGYLWGVTVRGTWGPFYAQIDYADVNGNSWIYAPGASGPSRGEGEAWKVGGSWGYMPGARIGLIWVKNTNNNAFGVPTTTIATGVNVSAVTTANGFYYGNRVNQQGWTLNWEHTFGNFQVMAQYGQTNDIKGCTSPVVGAAAAYIDCGDSSARGYMVGGRYFLSKRTWLFASWNMIDNKSNNFVDYTGGAQTSTVTAAGNVPWGADPQIWALGIFHQF
jgi:predicted porin